MKEGKQALRFEEKLELLEQLTAKMEEGSLNLEELLSVYEQGTQLSKELKKDLDTAQAALMELKDGKLNAYWVQCTNNMQTAPNMNEEGYPGYRNPANFIVVSDPYPTVTATSGDGRTCFTLMFPHRGSQPSS